MSSEEVPLPMSVLVRAAKAAVARAVALSTAVQGRLVAGATLAKADATASPVTIADFGVQAVIALSLAELLPRGSPLRMVGEEDDTTLRAAGEGVVSEVVRVVNAAHPKADGGAWSAEEVLGAVACGGYDGAASADAPRGSPLSAAWESGYWILDPIDGTRGFLRGGQYAVGLAYVRHGRVVLGAMGCPNIPYPKWDGTGTPLHAAAAAAGGAGGSGSGDVGCLFTAVRGHGTFMEPLAGVAAGVAASREGAAATEEESDLAAALSSRGAASRVQAAVLPSASSAIFAESFEALHGRWDLTQGIASALSITSPPLRLDSMCKYGLLARGDGHIYFRFPPAKHPVEYVWDHAAGSIVLEEAGGRVTDIYGKELDFSRGRTLAANKGVIATCGNIHEEVLAAVAAGWAADQAKAAAAAPSSSGGSN